MSAGFRFGSQARTLPDQMLLQPIAKSSKSKIPLPRPTFLLMVAFDESARIPCALLANTRFFEIPESLD